MDPEQRLWALDALASNPKLQKKRSTVDHDDGWDWYMAGKPFEAAWSLIGSMEPSPEAAMHLSTLLRDLPADSFKTEGIAEALGRWQATGEEALADEAKRNAEGRLSDFQEVRQAGARLLASRHDAEPDLFLDSDDLALRCGAYEAARKLDQKAMEAAVERDGDLARPHLIRNEALWRSEKTRESLLDLLRGSEGDEPRWEFRRRERYYRKEHPTWFAGEDDYSEPDERPIGESSIADVVAGITGGPAFRGLQERLAAVEAGQRNMIWTAWIVIVVLGVASIWK